MADPDELAHTVTEPASEATPSPQVPPVMLGKYRLERALGAGGMGVVHAAFDPVLQRRVAIKLLHARASVSPTNRARLLREARAMARLSHPNVMDVYEVGTIDGRDFVVMELVDGGSLAEWLSHGPHSEEEILDAFVSAGRGLAAAHAAGIVHRDFKPHNVLRSRTGHVLVTDFGLARGIEADPHPASERDAASGSLSGLTQTGALLGTPAYMAPEQWQGIASGPEVDQFAYCVALWEALAGERPFRGQTWDELQAQVERGPEELDASKIPPVLRPVLHRGLAPDPARRFPSMDALLDALLDARARAQPRRRSPLVVVAVASAAMGLIIAFAIAMLAGRDDDALAPRPDDRTEDPALAAVASVALPRTRDELLASIVKIDARTFEVPRATVEQLVQDRLIVEDAKIVPHQVGDEVRGFKLYAVRPRSVFRAFGLSAGDIITSVAGVPLSSPDALVQAFKLVRSSTLVIVGTVRDGNERPLSITIR